jgi:hypothetical protein
MKYTKNFVILIPLIVSSIFIAKSFYIFLTIVYPKLNQMNESELSLLSYGNQLHYYGIYLLTYTIIFLLITLFVIGSIFLKKQLNRLLYLCMFSVVAVYAVNMFSSISATLLVEGVYIPMEAYGDKQLGIIRDGINTCGCRECVSNYKQNINKTK